MTKTDTYLIVGGGLAGASAAHALRDEGFDGRIVLVGEEEAVPYERPPLSKGFLRGEQALDALLPHPPTSYEERDIELRTGTGIVTLDLAGSAAVTDAGERIAFSRLLLTTGSAARRLDVPGGDLDGIFRLRTIGDATAIREAAQGADRAVVVGGGWIGAEVAASLREMGLAVALVAPSSVPLEGVLGPEAGEAYRALHAERGVELHMNERVAGFTGTERVQGVATQSGRIVKGDLVVVGVGAVPRTELAMDAGLTVRGGVVVDEYLDAGGDVFAAGDVAAAWHPVLDHRVRVEHWDNAKRQGAAAARNMLGQRVPYDALPYFYSDQYDLGMEYVGYAPQWDRVVFRGDPAGREFIAFWLASGRPVAAMNANIWDVNDDLRAIVAAGRPIDPDMLADPAVPLADLAADQAETRAIA